MKNHILKTVDGSLQAFGGFRWPRQGPVEAPDWNPAAVCWGGLHGALNGEGDGSLLCRHINPVWIVAELPEDGPIVDLGGKVKVPRCTVVFAGSQKDATDLMRKLHPESRQVIGAFVTSGDKGNATSGDLGTSTSGTGGTSISGDHGTSTSGKGGTSISGDHGISTSGKGGTSTVGDHGTSTVGDYGTSTSGTGGTSTAGDFGTSISGARGTSISGDHGISTSGNGGTCAAGEGGSIHIHYWDGKRTKVRVGYIGEDGLEPGVTYRLNEHREFESTGTEA